MKKSAQKTKRKKTAKPTLLKVSERITKLSDAQLMVEIRRRRPEYRD